MRLRCSRTAKYLCWFFIIMSLVILVFFSFNTSSKMTVSDAILKTTSHNGSGNGNDVSTRKVSRVGVRSKLPVYHVNFLKVHKAGSTTVQNLMFRFGFRHNLTILVPRTGNYLNKQDEPIKLKSRDHFDIFACHTVFSKNVFGLLSTDSVNIGIIRDPLDRAISAAYYYRDRFHVEYLERIPRETFIEDLVSFPEKYESGEFSFTKNSMAKDFGFTAGLRNETENIKSHLEYLKKEFQVVMVMERFKESLVLLKRELGWSLEDIIFIQSNSHPHEPTHLTPEQRSKFRQTCHLDYAIYDTFYPIFEAKVAAEGPDFKEEVANFKSVLRDVERFCALSRRKGVSDLHVSESGWNERFTVTKRDCEQMTNSEIYFIYEIRARHRAMENGRYGTLTRGMRYRPYS